MLQTASWKGVGGERLDVTDSARGKSVVRVRRVVTDSASLNGVGGGET